MFDAETHAGLDEILNAGANEAAFAVNPLYARWGGPEDDEDADEEEEDPWSLAEGDATFEVNLGNDSSVLEDIISAAGSDPYEQMYDLDLPGAAHRQLLMNERPRFMFTSSDGNPLVGNRADNPWASNPLSGLPPHGIVIPSGREGLMTLDIPMGGNPEEPGGLLMNLGMRMSAGDQLADATGSGRVTGRTIMQVSECYSKT